MRDEWAAQRKDILSVDTLNRTQVKKLQRDKLQLIYRMASFWYNAVLDNNIEELLSTIEHPELRKVVQHRFSVISKKSKDDLIANFDQSGRPLNNYAELKVLGNNGRLNTDFLGARAYSNHARAVASVSTSGSVAATRQRWTATTAAQG
jgi:hypothetical protein